MLFTTIIKAKNSKGQMCNFIPELYVEAISFQDAQRWCDENGYGYLIVDGILNYTIDRNTGIKINYNILN